jgi:2-oxoglutarate ferredoxin oxidoreductase subunit alpha
LYHITGLFHDFSGFPTLNPPDVAKYMDHLMDKIDSHREDIIITEDFMLDGAEIVLVTYGCSARSARRAVRDARAKGWPVGMLRLATIWPFPEEQVRAVAEQARAVIVPEMNMGQLIYEVERVVGGRSAVAGVNRYDGEMITPGQIFAKIEELI